MPSNPASLASRRHSCSVIRAGYGNAQRLIDFFIRYGLGEHLRESTAGSAWGLAPTGCEPKATDVPTAAVSVERSALRRLIRDPDCAGSRGLLICMRKSLPVKKVGRRRAFLIRYS